MGLKLTISIDMDNAAFSDAPDQEAGRILRVLSDRMMRDGFPDRLPLRDINGNTVGKAEITRTVD